MQSHQVFCLKLNKILFFVIAIALLTLGGRLSSQTIVFHENFDGLNGGDSVSSTPISAWSLSSKLFVSPSFSDSTNVNLNDTVSLITNTFSTIGYSNVILTFDHICQIELSDAAEIFVSTNAGVSWSKLTDNQYYGSGQFGILNNKFNSQSYDLTWDTTNSFVIPDNSWWKHEAFDISNLVANSANVKVKFQLTDGNNNGASNNYGWFIDNIKVTVAVDELIPPIIVLNNPIIEDSVFFNGPYGIFAKITDGSGIDTALLIYRHNNSAFDTVGMVKSYGNVYYAKIDTIVPFYLGDSISYYISATDNSPSHNSSVFPFNSYISFKVYNSPPPPGCGNPISNYPYDEDFETGFLVGSGAPNSPGAIPYSWTRLPSGGNNFMWLVKAGSTPSAGTGPSGDHTSGNGVYLYAESSYGATNSQALLLMQCANINQLNVPYLEFYYHMNGSSMGELHVDIYYGGRWIPDIMPPIIGNQNDEWHKVSVNLSQYKSTTQIRFRAIRGGSLYSDIAIDDIKIWQPPSYDAGVIKIDAPLPLSGVGVQNMNLSIKNFGSKILNKVTVNWEIDNVLQTPYIWSGYLLPGYIADSVYIGQANFAAGPTKIKAWTSLPNDSVDAIAENDTSKTTIIACSAPLHGEFKIGGVNSDFVNFADALYAIENCGIDSAVIFNVAPGTYIEQLDIDTIPGASSINTVTFQSLNGDSTSVTLKYSAINPNENFVVRFNGASFIRFKDMSFRSIGNSYARGLVYENSASNISVENCRVVVNNGGSSNFTGFYFNNTISNDNKIINNDILNGCYGLYLASPSSTLSGKRNEISRNIFHNYHSYGAYIKYQDSLIINQNTFSNDTTELYTCGIYIYYGDGVKITNNKINSHGSISNYGLRMYYCNGLVSNPILIANNMISITGSSITPYGLDCYGSNKVDFFHNTINVSSTANSPDSKVLYLASSSNIRFKNNIFSNLANGYTYFIASSNAVTESDFNNIFTNGTTLAYWLGDKSNISALQAAINMEANSISLFPDYISNYDLHISNAVMNQRGTPIPQVPFDIDGDLRNSIAPALGADEKPPAQYDAGVVEILSPATYTIPGDTIQVQLRIKNFGLLPLTTMPISYQIDNNPFISENWTGNLASGNTLDFTFSTPFLAPPFYKISVKTDLNNDGNIVNDTISIFINKDVALTSVLLPQDTISFGDSVQVAVSIKNNGTDTVYSFNLEYDINNTGLIQESWNGSLSPDQSFVYAFYHKFQVNMGSNEICSRVLMNGDTKAGNNQNCKYVTGVVATQIAENEDFVLLQNSPNPFTTESEIRFSLPHAAPLTLSVFDIYGRRIKVVKLAGNYGENTYKISRNGLSAGIYFYKLNFENISKRLKMVIVN